MRAYSTKDGAILWVFNANRDFDTVNGVKANGGSMDGPVPSSSTACSISTRDMEAWWESLACPAGFRIGLTTFTNGKEHDNVSSTDH